MIAGTHADAATAFGLGIFTRRTSTDDSHPHPL